ncbi:hypothetical protein [Streptomyces galilaeus]|uniref:LamG domain-containing protein n=1 Tax=Streptomyces galilaeus TaxID=33899 RepID=A0ABW9J087_STRGJ
MPQLPPPLWAELYYDGVWNGITDDLRQTSPVVITRGLSSESASVAEPTSCECVLDSRDHAYAPRNPRSRLRGKLGRNTPMRLGYDVGSPWAVFDDPDELVYQALFVNDAAALDVAGDFDLRLDIALDDWSKSQLLALRAVPAANMCWALEIVNGALTLQWYPDGTTATRTYHSATEAISGYHGQRMAVRATLDINNGAGGREVRFYTGRTVDDTEWHLIGAPVTGSGTTSVFAGTAYMEIGGSFGASNLGPDGGFIPDMRGRAYALQLRDGIGGTVKVNMSTAAATPGGTTFVDATGLTWSRGGTSVLTNRHIRMAGEVPAWPPTRDLSGNDNTVAINPTGVTMRMDSGNKPVDSALLRYIKAHSPIDCWPFTDGADTIQAQSMTGGSPLRVSLGFGSTQPSWGTGALAEWIEPTISLAAGTDGVIAGAATLSDPGTTWSVDLFFSGVTATGASIDYAVTDRADGTDADPIGLWTVTVDKAADAITLSRASIGETASSVSSLVTVASPDVFDTAPHHLRLTVDISGATSPWQLYVDGVSAGSGTHAAPSKSPRRVRTGWFLNAVSEGTATPSFGYLTYWGSTAPPASQTYSALAGFTGELAGARIARLAAEAGYVATVSGETAHQEPMGIQGRKKLLELLQEANRTGFGYLLEARDRNELIHRGHSTLWNQPPALTLDFSAGLISPPFRPVDDDKLTENDVSVKREYGAVPARQVLEEGELSVQDFPSGVGRYDNEYTYSLETDSQAGHVAYMRVHLGTYNGIRYSRITLNIANDRVYALIDDILSVDCGDKLRLTNLPEDHGPDAVDVLVQGYTEEAGPDAWTITFNCVPAHPWTALVATQAPAAVTEGFEDASLDITITDGGTLPWLRTSAQFHSGAWSLRSGAIANNQTSVATVTVPAGATAFNFWYRTSSEASGSGFEGDRLTVNVGATQILRAQGTTPWTLFTTDVTGAATVTFTYTKDNSTATGEDAVYIDDLRFTIPTPLTTESRLDTGGCELAEDLTAVETAVDVTTTGERRWVDSSTYPDEFPFDIRVGGEVMRVTACTGTTASQTFTVTRSINGVSLTHSTGADVRLATPVYLSL